MRKIIFIVYLLIIGCNPVGNNNIKNLKKIEIGMSTDKVISIMGNPKRVMVFSEEKNELFPYVYTAPFASSDNIYILFGKDDSLVKIIIDGSE